MFFFPIYTFRETQADASFKEVKLTIQGRFEKDMSTNEYVLVKPNYAKSLMVLVIGLAFFVAIFRYENRVKQLRITRIMIILVFAFIITLLSSAYNTVNSPGISNVVTGIAVIFPSVSIVFAALATRAIKKDEELVKSADRLR